MGEPKPIEPLILTLRDQRVILDVDLAELYGVSTKRLNEQVKRNANRFPEDFMFQLTSKEWKNLKSQFATSSLEDAGSNRSQIATGSLEVVENAGDAPNRSQIVTGSQRHRDPRFMPYAFTEHGAIMAASILNSPEAVAMSVLNRAFGSILHGKIIYRFAFRWCGRLCRCASGWLPTPKSSSGWRKSTKPCWSTIRPSVQFGGISSLC